MATYIVVHSSGKYHDQNAFFDVLDYCTQDKKTPHGFIFGYSVDPEYAAEEMQDLAAAYGKDSGLRLRHSVLSFSPGEAISTIEAAEIAQQAIRFYGERYQIVAAVHEDTDNPHIHFVMNQISFKDGSRYRGKKDDYYKFQQHLKKILKMYGIQKLILGD